MDATQDRERAVGMPISADIVYVNKSPISPTRRGGGSRGLFVLTVLCLLGFGGFAFMAGRHTGRHDGKDMVVEHNAHEHNTMHTYFLLDRTGSMSSLKKAVEDGYESYIREQQATKGTMYLTVAQFDSDDPFEVVIESKEIQSAPRRLANYQPRSMTPLYDAIDRTINYAERTSDGSPDVVIVVFTDGHENASRKATRQSVFNKIEEKKKRGWTFVFLGANIDSYATGGSMGYSAGSTMNYAPTKAGLDYGWGTVSKAMLNQRVARARKDYTSADRMAAAASFFDGAK